MQRYWLKWHRMGYGEDRFAEVTGICLKRASAACGEDAGVRRTCARGGSAVRVVDAHGCRSAQSVSAGRLEGSQYPPGWPSVGLGPHDDGRTGEEDSAANPGPHAGPIEAQLCLVDAAGGERIARGGVR